MSFLLARSAFIVDQGERRFGQCPRHPDHDPKPGSLAHARMDLGCRGFGSVRRPAAGVPHLRDVVADVVQDPRLAQLDKSSPRADPDLLAVSPGQHGPAVTPKGRERSEPAEGLTAAERDRP
jgi:hypothetical protein